MNPSVLVACVILAAGNTPAGGDDPVLPAWFWDAPRVEGVGFAVGYSRPYRDSPTAYREAFEDAAWRLFSDANSVVAGERGVATAPGGTMDMGSTFKQSVDSAGFQDFLAGVCRLDSITAGGMRIVLVATRAVGVDCNPVPASGLQAPEVTPPVGFGLAPRYYFPSSSWREAEFNARVDLARSGASELKGATLRQDESILQTVVQKVGVRLVSVETVHRRFESVNGIFQVWAVGRVTTLED